VEKLFHGPTLAGPTKGWIFVFLPWGGPQVGSQSLVASCGSTLLSPEAAASVVVPLLPPHLLPLSLLSLSLPLPLFLLPLILSLLFLLPLFFLLFFIFIFSSSSIFSFVQCTTGHSWRNVKPLWYERLLQWQQNGSKAVMWQLYKIAAIWGCPRRFYEIVSCLLHVSTAQPLHITAALQEHVCGPSCSCKHRFCWISLIFGP